MTRPTSQNDTEVQRRQALHAHLSMVFDYCEGFAPVRLLRETGTGDARPSSCYPKADGSLADEVHKLIGPAADDQRGLYVVPCTVTSSGRAKAGDIFQTCVIPVDLDTGDIQAKRSHLERHLGQASMIVRSGGQTADGQAKLHLYWKLTEACFGDDLDKVVEVRGLIIDAVDADEGN